MGVGGWRLAGGGGWQQLADGGSWRMAVVSPWGLSFRAVLSKKRKKSGCLRTALPLGARPWMSWAGAVEVCKVSLVVGPLHYMRVRLASHACGRTGWHGCAFVLFAHVRLPWGHWNAGVARRAWLLLVRVGAPIWSSSNAHGLQCLLSTHSAISPPTISAINVFHSMVPPTPYSLPFVLRRIPTGSYWLSPTIQPAAC